MVKGTVTLLLVAGVVARAGGETLYDQAQAAGWASPRYRGNDVVPAPTGRAAAHERTSEHPFPHHQAAAVISGMCGRR